MKMVAMAVCAALLCTMSSAASAEAAHSCAPQGSEPAVVQAMRDFFIAARTDDEAAFRRVVTDGFYAFDGGKRFNGMALFDLLKTIRASGRRIEWSVTEPQVEEACDVAVIAYVNQGAAGDAQAMKPVTWLESATLHYQDGRWRVAFLNSQRTTP